MPNNPIIERVCKEWSEEDRQLAGEAFDILGRFFMKNCNQAPQSILEACDYVSNYLGDISMGREITLDKPADAFPTLLTLALAEQRKELDRLIEKKKVDDKRFKTKYRQKWDEGLNLGLTTAQEIINTYKPE